MNQEQEAYQQDRKDLAIYAKVTRARIPFTLNRSTNIFFRQMRMVKHTARFLGPGALEMALKQLREEFGLFYLRHEYEQQILDYTSTSQNSQKWDCITRIYTFQMVNLDWLLSHLDTCIRNIESIDARKERILMDITRKPFIENYGYMQGVHELQTFICYTNTNVIDQSSILQFICHIVQEMKQTYPAKDIYNQMREFESNLSLLSSFLKWEFDVTKHLEMKIY
jgi:hypothetical protein